MEPVTIIATAIELVNLATKSIEAANNGDAAKAKDFLEQARSRYDAARAKWDAAPGPTDA